MAPRLQKIDEHTRPDHSYLDEGDECYYVSEYTPRQGFHYSETNDLIINLKKPVDRRGRPEYEWKEWAIRRSGDLLRSVLSADWIPSAMLLPIPCSKAKGHPLYDDRILQVIRRMTQGLRCDVRELVLQTQSLESFHDGSRMRPDELKEYYALDEELCNRQPPTEVAIFDDLLTTGSHFRAMKAVINEHWPNVPVSGIFIARRYIPQDAATPTPGVE
ncbi:MAG: hypothetical protein ACRD23_00350 [Terriglobales bacterium]